VIELLFQLAPVFFYFVVGLLLKRFGLADKSHGDFILRLVFFVTLPILILTTVPSSSLSLDKILLPLSNILVSLLCFTFMFLLLKNIRVSKKTQGTMLIAGMTPNNTYMFPFILTVYGSNGFADAILFDFGNALLVSTFTYVLAFRYGEAGQAGNNALNRILRSPLFWALLIAVLLSVTNNPLPFYLQSTIRPLGDMTSPLILIALGIFFSLRWQHLQLVSLLLGLRMVLGLFFGWLVATLIGLQGLSFTIVLLCSAAPIGFTVLTFSSLARLDTELASSAVSLSILLGLLWVPLLMLLV